MRIATTRTSRLAVTAMAAALLAAASGCSSTGGGADGAPATRDAARRDGGRDAGKAPPGFGDGLLPDIGAPGDAGSFTCADVCSFLTAFCGLPAAAAGSCLASCQALRGDRQRCAAQAARDRLCTQARRCLRVPDGGPPPDGRADARAPDAGGRDAVVDAAPDARADASPPDAAPDAAPDAPVRPTCAGICGFLRSPCAKISAAEEPICLSLCAALPPSGLTCAQDGVLVRDCNKTFACVRPADGGPPPDAPLRDLPPPDLLPRRDIRGITCASICGYMTGPSCGIIPASLLGTCLSQCASLTPSQFTCAATTVVLKRCSATVACFPPAPDGGTAPDAAPPPDAGFTCANACDFLISCGTVPASLRATCIANCSTAPPTTLACVATAVTRRDCPGAAACVAPDAGPPDAAPAPDTSALPDCPAVCGFLVASCGLPATSEPACRTLCGAAPLPARQCAGRAALLGRCGDTLACLGLGGDAGGGGG